MKRLFVAAMALALAACTGTGGVTSVPTSPAEIADRTTIDERAMNALEAAATAAPKAATLAIRAEIITDPVAIARIGQLNEKLDLAMRKLEVAYEATNAETFWPLYREALGLVQSLNGIH